MTELIPEPGVFDMHVEGIEPADVVSLDQWPKTVNGSLTNSQKTGYVTQLLTILTTELTNE